MFVTAHLLPNGSVAVTREEMHTDASVTVSAMCMPRSGAVVATGSLRGAVAPWHIADGGAVCGGRTFSPEQDTIITALAMGSDAAELFVATVRFVGDSVETRVSSRGNVLTCCR